MWLNERRAHQSDVHRVRVSFAVNSYGLDTELSRGPDDPTCDFTTIPKRPSKMFREKVVDDVPVSYEDLVEMWFVVIQTLRMVG